MQELLTIPSTQDSAKASVVRLRPWMFSILRCTACGEAFGSQEQAENLRCTGCSRTVPVLRGIPRFVPTDDYVSSFSFEWTRFSTTQLDSARGWKQSEERFQENFNFPLEQLRGKRILDVGCGMGRFAEIAAKHGAEIVGIDLSFAVEVASKNLSRWPNAQVIQADARKLPFAPESFDIIYSLGVLHHTPDPQGTFNGLMPFLKPGGSMSITLYSKYNRIYVTSTNLWRVLTTRLPNRLVYGMSHLAIPIYYLYRIPFFGFFGKAFWPISMHPDPEWRLLDTFDCYSPKYQNFYDHPEVYAWFRDAGLEKIAVLVPAISFIGTKPMKATPERA